MNHPALLPCCIPLRISDTRVLYGYLILKLDDKRSVVTAVSEWVNVSLVIYIGSSLEQWLSTLHFHIVYELLLQ